MQKKFSLRLQLFLLILVAILLIVSLSVYNLLYSANNMEFQIDFENQSILELTDQMIQSQFTSYLDELRAVSNVKQVKSMDWQQMEEVILAVQKQLADHWEMLLVTDLNGDAKTSAGVSANIADREYFKNKMSVGAEQVIADPVISKVSKVPVTVLGVPIRENGQIVGYLGGTIRVDSFLQGIKDAMSHTADVNFSIFLVDAQGMILAHENEKLVLNVNATKESNYISASLATYIKEALKEDYLHGDYSEAGEERLGFSKKLEGANDWTLVLTYAQADLYQAIESQKNVNLIAGLIAFVVLILFGFIFTELLIRKTRKIVNAAEQMGEGDLTVKVEIKAKDELGLIGEQFNIMADNMKDVMENVGATADSVMGASQQLARAALESSASSEEVSASIEEVASRANEQSSAMDKAATFTREMAKEVNSLGQIGDAAGKYAQATAQNAQKGQEAILQILRQIEEIKTAIDETTQVVGELVNKSNKIGEIVDIINRIANQTQLLALNAAIEAARAGEAGKGFAVVADEIKTLAEETVTSAAQISELINDTQLEAERANKAMVDGSDKVVAGNEVVHSTKIIFEDIVQAADNNLKTSDETIQRVDQLIVLSDEVLQNIEDVAAISQETSASAEEVSASTEEQAATIEEVSASADTLREMAEKLIQALKSFTLE